MIPTFNTKEEYINEIDSALTDIVIDKYWYDHAEYKHEFKLVKNYVKWLKRGSFDHVEEAYRELIHAKVIKIV